VRPSVWPLEGPSPRGARWLLERTSAVGCFVTLGPLALAALEAARELPGWSVLDARFAAPLDEEALARAARTGQVVIAEEASLRGGLASATLELFAKLRLAPRVSALGLPDAFVPHGDARQQRKQYGLDAAGLAAAARALS